MRKPNKLSNSDQLNQYDQQIALLQEQINGHKEVLENWKSIPPAEFENLMRQKNIKQYKLKVLQSKRKNKKKNQPILGIPDYHNEIKIYAIK